MHEQMELNFNVAPKKRIRIQPLTSEVITATPGDTIELSVREGYTLKLGHVYFYGPRWRTLLIIGETDKKVWGLDVVTRNYCSFDKTPEILAKLQHLGGF